MYVVLSHASDIDGVGSAALLIRRYAIPLENVFFTEYSDKSMAYAIGRVRRLAAKGITLFITDLGISEQREHVFEDLVSYINKHGGRVLWFDHHVWSANAVRNIASMCEVAVVGESREFCAAEITRAMLGLSDKFALEFTRIVHYSDFNLRPRDRKTGDMVAMYALAIADYNALGTRSAIDGKLRRLASVISKGRLSDSTLEKDAKAFEEISKRRVSFLLSHLYLGKNVAVAFAGEKVNATHTCNQIAAISKKKVVVLVDLFNGRGHLRTGYYDISGIARDMMGGGHPHAAGFTVDMKGYGGLRSERQKQRFVDMIDAQIDRLRPHSG